ASNAVVNDSTLEPEAAKFAWYRPAAEAYNAAKRATAARFHAGSATVSADKAVFEWVVDDSTPFPVNRAETPPDRTEYQWDVAANASGRYYRFMATTRPRSATAAPTT